MSTVEWKKLWEVTTWDKKFNGVEKHMQPKTISYPYVLANYFKEIEAKNGNVRLLSTGDYIGWTTEELAGNNLCNGEIVAIPWGGYANIKYYNGKFVTADNRIATSSDKNKLVTKYLYYFFCKNQETLDGFYRGAGIKHPSMRDVLCMEIPLPDVDIQQAIVNQLDTFTTLISRLESELELRQKQYEHYREELLNFDGDEEVERKTINSVADNYTGLTYKPTDVVNSGVLVLRSSNIKDGALSFDDNVYVDEDMNIPNRTLVKENDILICVRNGSQALVGKCALIPHIKERVAFGAFMSILRARSIHYKYLLHIWKSNLVQGQIKGNTGAPINQITSAHFKSISIPIPSKHRQQQIVSQLDTFEQLITALKREIALRQKQYEYYREKLLTFDE